MGDFPAFRPLLASRETPHPFYENLCSFLAKPVWTMRIGLVGDKTCPVHKPENRNCKQEADGH
jgi:hypothetical protein